MIQRRWLMTFVVAICCIGCEPANVDPQAAVWQPLIEQEEAFVSQHEGVRKKVLQLGGAVSAFRENVDKHSPEFSLLIDLSNNPQIDDADLVNLLDGSPTRLLLVFTSITDDGLAAIRNDPGLTHLALSGTSVGNSAIAHLRTLPSLRGVGLGKTNVTDEGLQELASISTLEEVSLPQTSVTDIGISALPSLGRLWLLDLKETQVTDNAIDELMKIKTLKMVWLSGTEVTAAGAERLRKALPLCKVHY